MKNKARPLSVDRIRTNIAKHVKLRTYYKWRVKSRNHFGFYQLNEDCN